VLYGLVEFANLVVVVGEVVVFVLEAELPVVVVVALV